jgi:predicted PurR-regulated permease PerM
METKKYTFDKIVRWVITISVLIGLYLLVQRLSGVLTPFLIAIMIAYYMNPLVNFFQKKIKKRGLSILLSFISIVIIFGGAIAILTPLVSNEIQNMKPLIKKFSESDSIRELEGLPGIVEEYINKYKNTPEIKEYLGKLDFQTILGNVTEQITSVLGTSVSLIMGVFSIFIIILYVVFILADYPDFASNWQKLIPSKYRNLSVRLIKDFQDGMDNYFKAQATVALLVGVLFAIGFSIIGLPMAILFGLFVGLLNMVPYLQLGALLPAMFLALMLSVESGNSFGYSAMLVLLVFAVVQIIQDAVLVPKIMGNITSMNPAIILLSLSIWGSLLGVVGMIIAIPITTLIISYYRSFIQKL